MSVKTLKTPFTDREIAQVEITSAHGCGIRMVDPGTYVFRATMPWLWALTDGLAEDNVGVNEVDAGEEVTVTLEPGDSAVVRYCKLSETLPGQMTPLRVVYDRPAPVDGVAGVITDANNNTVGGASAGASLAAGSNFNVLLGKSAGTLITTGDQNVAVGTNALASEVTGSDNTAVGGNALSTATGSNNTAVGSEAAISITSGVDNVAVGKGALATATLAGHNVAVGKDALAALTTPDYNTACGALALANDITGAQNTALGYTAGYSITTGQDNVAIGKAALSVGNPSGNVAIGLTALQGSSGANNTAVGHQAGLEIAAGTGNALIGTGAGLGQGDVSNKFMVGLGNGQGLIFSIDEMGALLNISVRYADGTMKAIAGLALT